MKMKWKEITNNEDIWEFEEMGELEGKYTRIREGVGMNNSNLYCVEKDGKEVAFWGNTLLNNMMRSIQIGSMIRIKYLGTAKSKKTGQDYKNFKIEVGEEE